MNLEVQRGLASDELAPARASASRSRLRARLFLCLAALDAICILCAFWLAATIWRVGDDDAWVVISRLLVPVYLVLAINYQAYSPEVIQSAGRGVERALRALGLASVGVILIAFSLKTSTELSRMTYAIGFGLSVVMVGGARALFLGKAKRFLGGNPFTVMLIVDGDQPIPEGEFSEIIHANALFDPDEHCPEMYDRLALTLQDADRVIVACGQHRRQSWANALKGANIQSEIVAPEFVYLAPLGLNKFGSSPTIIVAQGPLSFTQRAIKRAFDITLAVLALVMLLPVFACTALLIKLGSPGPVFFVQPRIGRGNRVFRMLKFRSMRVERSDGHGHASTARDDDRVTRLGRFIRKTSIDELPQLFNVLQGDMSIVGPRPHALGSRAENLLFWEIDERYWSRHAAKPGLTGLAQIRGFRGATLRQRDLTDRLHSDLEYLKGWTIWRDIRIILMTFSVLVHPNAF